MPSRRFRRGRGGTVRVSLPRGEIAVIHDLAAEMEQLIGQGPPEEVSSRLYPRAYDDPTLDAEYRRLMARDLEERKAADLATFLATLERQPPLELTGDEANAWLGALQDMRLTLGTMLGITEDGWESESDRDDPQFAVLHYLGYLQDSLVGVIS